MRSSGKPFTTVTLEDGTFAVVRSDPRKPQFLEVIAIFLDAARARSYAEMENDRSGEGPVASTEASKNSAPLRKQKPYRSSVRAKALC